MNLSLNELINYLTNYGSLDSNVRSTILKYLEEYKNFVKSNHLSVRTPSGTLHVETTPDIENYLNKNKDSDVNHIYYPGISVWVENVHGEYVDLCTIEGPSDENNINMYVYSDPHSDEYTNKISIPKHDIDEL